MNRLPQLLQDIVDNFASRPDRLAWRARTVNSPTDGSARNRPGSPTGARRGGRPTRAAGGRGRPQERHTYELHEDVENLAAMLASLGITVHRPLPLPEDALPIAELGWQAAPTPALNVRDNTILGDEIIETAPAIRSRYLETRLLTRVFRHYADAGARCWSTMPRPTLTDASFYLSYARDTATTLGGPTEPITDPQSSPYDVGLEIMQVDAPTCEAVRL
jgi:glycine amidinotransferase